MEIREIDNAGRPAARVSLDQLAEKAGRKRGRPAMPAPPPVEISAVDPVVVKSTFKIGFHAGYVLTNFEGWKLTDDEADHLQKAWQPVFDKYIAPNFADYIIIFNAVGALGTVVFGKVKANAEWKKELKRKAQEQKSVAEKPLS